MQRMKSFILHQKRQWVPKKNKVMIDESVLHFDISLLTSSLHYFKRQFHILIYQNVVCYFILL